MHEVWAYNLYPGPSAKKGVFSLLLDIGEQEGWVCCHTSAAMVETPYECEVVFMHEGASGGGKSEMLEDFHREEDDRLLIGTHTVTGEKYYMTLGESCKIHPIADDMACALKSFQDPESGKLRILDAEDGWFLRMDGMNATVTARFMSASVSIRASRWSSSTWTARPVRPASSGSM